MPTVSDITDIHAHLIPGLDDGPGDMAASLDMCRLYAADGVTTVVATPHMSDPRYPVSAEAVRDGVRAVQAACRGEGIELRILPGADVRLQPEVLDDLDAGRVLTLGDAGRFLLLELPPQILCPLDSLLFGLEVRGLRAILTHPERHPMFAGDVRRLEGLVSRGCLVQITGASLLGVFGPRARRAAESMLARGLVHAVASDAHGPAGPRSPQLGAARARLRKLVGEEEANQLLCVRPAAIVSPAGHAVAGAEDAAEEPVR